MFGSDFSEVKYRLVSVVRIVLSLDDATRGTAKLRVLSRLDLPTFRFGFTCLCLSGFVVFYKWLYPK
jgi:hypothetical protein